MSSPSAVRVFSKSLHLLAAGWTLCAVLIGMADVQQRARRDHITTDFLVATLVHWAAGVLLVEALAIGVARLAGPAPTPVERREWRQAVWWSAVPNLLLLGTALLLVAGT